MDTALTNSIVSTATSLASSKNSDALNMHVLKKALNIQANTAATLLEAVPQLPQQPALATSGTLGTKLHAIA
jgi:hypothetical protein